MSNGSFRSAASVQLQRVGACSLMATVLTIARFIRARWLPSIVHFEKNDRFRHCGKGKEKP